jgi:hypothetical protein
MFRLLSVPRRVTLLSRYWIVPIVGRECLRPALERVERRSKATESQASTVVSSG